jgi:hypothetical protein
MDGRVISLGELRQKEKASIDREAGTKSRELSGRARSA